MSKPRKDTKIEIPEQVLKQILTPSEMRMLRNRWQIIRHLENGLSIRQVAEKVKVGTDTVVRVARMLEKSSLQKLLGKERKQMKSTTPWIFGKTAN